MPHFIQSVCIERQHEYQTQSQPVPAHLKVQSHEEIIKSKALVVNNKK